MSSRKISQPSPAAAVIDASYRLESTRVLASAIGLLYLAGAIVLGALLHAWKGWALVVAALVIFAIIGVLSVAHLAVRAVRERDALRRSARLARPFHG